jgi:hypothetical protein
LVNSRSRYADDAPDNVASAPTAPILWYLAAIEHIAPRFAEIEPKSPSNSLTAVAFWCPLSNARNRFPPVVADGEGCDHLLPLEWSGVDYQRGISAWCPAAAPSIFST